MNPAVRKRVLAGFLTALAGNAPRVCRRHPTGWAQRRAACRSGGNPVGFGRACASGEGDGTRTMSVGHFYTWANPGSPRRDKSLINRGGKKSGTELATGQRGGNSDRIGRPLPLVAQSEQKLAL